MSGAAQGNFGLSTTGLSSASITGMSGSEGTDTRTISVDTGPGEGTIRVDLANVAPTITDAVGHALTATYSSGTALIVDRTAPTVSSIVPVNPVTNAATAVFTVTFDELVNGVAVGNFGLTTTGVSGASVASVAGSDGTNTRTVTVNTGSGDGTIRLDLNSASPAIIDLGANALTDSYSLGTLLTVDKTNPTASVSAPLNDVTLISSPTVIGGTAIDTGGAGLSKVEVSIQRSSDNKYYGGGSTWNLSPTWLLASTGDASAHWTIAGHSTRRRRTAAPAIPLRPVPPTPPPTRLPRLRSPGSRSTTRPRRSAPSCP